MGPILSAPGLNWTKIQLKKFLQDAINDLKTMNYGGGKKDLVSDFWKVQSTRFTRFYQVFCTNFFNTRFYQVFRWKNLALDNFYLRNTRFTRFHIPDYIFWNLKVGSGSFFKIEIWKRLRSNYKERKLLATWLNEFCQFAVYSIKTPRYLPLLIKYNEISYSIFVFSKVC